MSRCSLRFYDTIRRGNCQPGAKRLFASVREDFCEAQVCAPLSFLPRSASLSLRLAFSVRILFSLCHGLCIGLRKCQASAWPEVATFLIKRKWPKIDRGGPRPPLRRQAVQGGSGLARHWFNGRFQAFALPLVELWAVLRSAGLLEGPGSLARH